MASIAPLDPSESCSGGQGGATTRALSPRSDLSLARGCQPAGGRPRPGAGADDGPEVRPARGRRPGTWTRSGRCRSRPSWRPRWGRRPSRPATPSGVEPYRAVVEQLLARGRGDDDDLRPAARRTHGYRGSYSSVRRFVQRSSARTRRARWCGCTRGRARRRRSTSAAPGRCVDPRTGQPRRAWVFVMTLGYSRHQYAELVFDQKVQHLDRLPSAGVRVRSAGCRGGWCPTT